jgi:hypothetical protein
MHSRVEGDDKIIEVCKPAKASPLKEFPWKGFYGGSIKRIIIDYDDLSSTCIGEIESLRSMEQRYTPKLTENEAVELMIKAYWGLGPYRPFDKIDECFKNEMRAGMRDAIQAAEIKFKKEE